MIDVMGCCSYICFESTCASFFLIHILIKSVSYILYVFELVTLENALAPESIYHVKSTEST